MSSMLTLRLMPVDKSREAYERRSVCHPSFELSDPRAFDCKNHISAPESSRPEWLLPKDTSDANTQSPGAAYDDFSFHASSASTACGGIGNGRREESVFGGPSMPATYDRRTCKV